MAFFKALQSFFTKPSPSVRPGEGERPADRDTVSVINDLSRLVRNDPEAVDVYLALGNLFRAQGDIERAVLIREGLIARPNLNTQFKARACFELGQDYYRAGVVDRALAAFREAALLGYPQKAVMTELAELFAYAGDFEKAAEEYGRLGHSLAQAHYLVRRAGELHEADETAKAQKLLKRALKIYPGSVEGWNASIRMMISAKAPYKTGALLERAFARVAPHLRFLLLDALLETLAEPSVPSPMNGEETAEISPSGPDSPLSFAQELCGIIIPILEKQEPDILVQYYGALLLQRGGDTGNVDIWLAKTLVMQPHFWAARLQSLALSVQKHELPPVVGMQVTNLADELKHIRRFVCTVCGFRENQVFYRCRRCGSWHSLAFRLSLRQ